MHIPISWTGSKFESTKVYSHLIQTKAYLLTFQCAKPPLGTCFKEELQRRSVGHVLSKIRTQCILMTGQGLYLCASTARTIVTHQSQPRSGSFEPRRRPERRREKVSRSSWLQFFFAVELSLLPSLLSNSRSSLLTSEVDEAEDN